MLCKNFWQSLKLLEIRDLISFGLTCHQVNQGWNWCNKRGHLYTLAHFWIQKGAKIQCFPLFSLLQIMLLLLFFSSCKWENSAKNMSRKSIHTFLSYVLADAAPIWKIIKILEFKETNILAHFWFKMTHSI